MLSIFVTNGAVNRQPIDQPGRYVLHAGIEWIELSNVTDMILSHFRLDLDIHAVRCDETASGVIRMTSELTQMRLDYDLS